ncbi:acetoacetyl-CoA synthetase [Mycena alexandri]|uniref:Acetoacetyl-CoA synthetase n=1 Tax=Mycena alexandri TaxID=1745969 RepID=A0AAD6XCH4_9AGAR|nr:acetoacetyl-CoA synthetase [Mycena alexandri]
MLRPSESNNAPLYLPKNPNASATFQFKSKINTKYNLDLRTYADLWFWSTSHIADFWTTAWDAMSIIGEKGTHIIDESLSISTNPAWFNDAKINYAENMLHCRSSEKVALIQATEPTPLNSTPDLRRCTYAQLYELVSQLVSSLLVNGLKPGDRVASYSSNSIENVALCLATTAIGAIFVSAAADFGPAGVLERFEQVKPTFIFAVDAVVYNAKVHDHLPKLAALLSGLGSKSAPKVVIMHPIPYLQDRSAWQEGWVSWDEFILQGEAEKLGRSPSGEILWHRASFNWPLWILFSSGSTGEAIVHRAGGMLLQAKKEFVICADLQPTDVFFYYTTTGWMMYNFLIAGLSVGCTLVLYDGSPLRDPAFLWKLTDDLKISIFGTSAKYLDELSKQYKPREHHDLSSLRHIYSTGSPLSAALFNYVYEHIHPDVLLGSITGGTDICSLFAGMCSALPVYAGEIQCRMLGMAIESYSETGSTAAPDAPGELVCLKPFPCMPAGFWPLPGFGTDDEVAAAKARYHQAYFAEIDGVWYHGDHIVITRPRAGNGGGLKMLGRSDGVLNPGGVRFGSSELYDVIDSAFCSTGKILDCLAVGQTIGGGSDERVVLFVKLPDTQELSDTLVQQIKDVVRQKRSPRHVPARIIQVREIPYTLNGKRVEVLVKKIINGAPLSIVNPATLSNAECLVFYHDIGVKLRAES